MSAVVGLVIGLERSLQDQPAGVRTMSLVSLGACIFTMVGNFGFPGKYDASRMAAAVCSGVGFIGAGVITTGNQSRRIDFANVDTVHGMTTAAAIWVSAACGVCVGCGLGFVGVAAGLVNVVVVTAGKRLDIRSRRRYQRLERKKVEAGRGGFDDFDNPNYGCYVDDGECQLQDEFDMKAYEPPYVDDVKVQQEDLLTYGLHSHLTEMGQVKEERQVVKVRELGLGEFTYNLENGT